MDPMRGSDVCRYHFEKSICLHSFNISNTIPCTLRVPCEAFLDHRKTRLDLDLMLSVNSGSRILTLSVQVTSADPNAISSLPTLSSVRKYTMPSLTYETLPETVLAYKKAHKIGRFDPEAPDIQDRKIKEMWNEVDERSTLLSSLPFPFDTSSELVIRHQDGSTLLSLPTIYAARLCCVCWPCRSDPWTLGGSMDRHRA